MIRFATLKDRFRRRRRPLTALQVEVSSRCTRRCALCPQAVLRRHWQGGFISQAAWNAIRPGLPCFDHVHLQGWGEPLLHEHLPAMVADAKSAGCTVGITTNGDLLSQHTQPILEKGVDLISVSIAGAHRFNPRLRDRENLDQALETIRRFHHARKEKGVRIKLQVAYLLTAENACELPAALEAIADTGADECYAIHLDVTPTSEVWAHAAFHPDHLQATTAWLEKAQARARKLSLPFRPPQMQAEGLLTCALDPRRFVYISSDGRVGPCVNQLLPIDGPLVRWDSAGLHTVSPKVFGNLSETPLDILLASDARTQWIAAFEMRMQAERGFLAAIPLATGRQALHELDRADEKRQNQLDRHPFPPECTGCHKRWGW